MANLDDYTSPRNFTEARRLARDFGFVIRKDYDWGVIKVYPEA